MSRFFRPGLQIHAMPFRKGIWQIAVFTIGQDWDDDDHEEYPLITWYVQFLFWQFSYSRELPYAHQRNLYESIETNKPHCDSHAKYIAECKLCHRAELEVKGRQ